MTRSVEIPEAAVDAAQKAWTKAYWTEATPAKNDWMRAALAAALPYLAPGGDGGLREALEKLADRYSGNDDEPILTVNMLRAELAAHPS